MPHTVMGSVTSLCMQALCTVVYLLLFLVHCHKDMTVLVSMPYMLYLYYYPLSCLQVTTYTSQVETAQSSTFFVDMLFASLSCCRSVLPGWAQCSRQANHHGELDRPYQLTKSQQANDTLNSSSAFEQSILTCIQPELQSACK